MKFEKLKAFSMIEALVGFILLSMMLLLYLPGYQLQLQKMNQMRQSTARWELFHQIVRLSFEEQDYHEFIQQQIAATDIVAFDCSQIICWIEFEDGVRYEVSVEAIQP